MNSQTRAFANQAFDAVGHDLEGLFDQLFYPTNGKKRRNWAPPVSVWEEENLFGVDIELPGVSMDDVEVTFDKGQLNIEAKRERPNQDGRNYRHDERFWGEMSRSIKVPDTVDAESIQASYSQGQLQVRLQKRPEVLPRKIQVKVD
jgi:HSP20 family protein